MIDFRFEPDPAVVLARLQASVQAAGSRAVELFALDTWGNIAEEAPTDHGRLAGGFTLERAGVDTWRIATAVEYAEAVHEGTKPHVIEARNARALRFEINGTTIFARRVNHPGTKANPFVDRAIDRAEGRTEEFVTRALQEQGLI